MENIYHGIDPLDAYIKWWCEINRPSGKEKKMEAPVMDTTNEKNQCEIICDHGQITSSTPK